MKSAKRLNKSAQYLPSCTELTGLGLFIWRIVTTMADCSDYTSTNQSYVIAGERYNQDFSVGTRLNLRVVNLYLGI